VKLPNGKEILSLVWIPRYLPRVFEIISKSEVKNSLCKNNVVTVD
jgi:hypothetical protein